MTAWAAKFSRNAISFSESGRTSSRPQVITPSSAPSLRSANARLVRKPRSAAVRGRTADQAHIGNVDDAVPREQRRKNRGLANADPAAQLLGPVLQEALHRDTAEGLASNRYNAPRVAPQCVRAGTTRGPKWHRITLNNLLHSVDHPSSGRSTATSGHLLDDDSTAGFDPNHKRV